MQYKYQFFTDTGCIEHISPYELNLYSHFKAGVIRLENNKGDTYFINMNLVRDVKITKLAGLKIE